MLKEKICAGACNRGCKNILPLDMFAFDELAPDGYKDICLSCQNVLANKIRIGKIKAARERNESPRMIREAAYYVENEAKKKAKQYRDAHKKEWAQLRKISSEVYDSLHEKQSGLCAICNTDPAPKRLVIDHEHGTDPVRVRGLICGHCNSALGFARDNIENLKRMITYLEKT